MYCRPSSFFIFISAVRGVKLEPIELGGNRTVGPGSCSGEPSRFRAYEAGTTRLEPPLQSVLAYRNCSDNSAAIASVSETNECQG